VERELRDLLDLVAHLEQPARGFVAQIVKAQILDLQEVARAGECGPHAPGIVRKDVRACAWLGFHHRPRTRWILEAPMIAFLGRWVLGIAHHTGLVRLVVVRPLQAQISASRRAEVRANSITLSIGIRDRLSRRAK
jgi:hypothetical protein